MIKGIFSAVSWVTKKSFNLFKKTSQFDVSELLAETNLHLKNIDNEMMTLNSSIKEQNLLITKGVEIAQESLEVAQESLLVQKYVALQQNRDRILNRQKEIYKDNLEQKSKYLREAFFQLKNELDELVNPQITSLEKYLSTLAIQEMFKQYKITTQMTDDLFEKQLIQDSFNKVKEINNNSEKRFISQDKSDIKLIGMIINNEVNIEENKLIDLKKERKSMNKNFKTKIKNLKETQSFAFILKNYPEIVIKIK